MPLIEVRPIEKKSWHGKKGKENFKQPEKLSALVNGETLEYATGLTQEEVEIYGKKLRQDLNPQFNRDDPHPFWDSPMAAVTLENKTMFLNTDLPLEFIHVKIMKASKYVANSVREYNDGHFPDATHVIFDEREEVEVKAAKILVKQKAITEAGKLTNNQKAQIVLLISGKIVKGKSDDFMTVELSKLIENDAEEVLRYIQRDATVIAGESMVAEALQKNVLRRAGHKVMYHDFDLGSELSDVSLYLEKPENQTLKLKILEAIN